MRNEKLMPHGATHRQRAVDRVLGPVDWMDELEQQPEPQPEVVGLGEMLRGEVELTTRTQGGSPAVIRIPHSILAVLVTITLALIAGGFWLVSSITEMKTNLVTIQQNQRDIKTQQSSNLKLMTAYATNETSRIQFMTGLLTKEQQERVYQFDRANPRPQLPDTNDSPDERNQEQ